MPAADLLARAFAEFRPRERLDVHECARRHRVLVNPGGGYSGPWSDDQTPFLVRPMRCLTALEYSLVVLMGPSQSAKSATGENWIAHSAICDPGNIVWLAPDKQILRDYVVQKINPMIRASPEVAARLLRTPSSDNTFSKEFRGMTVSFVWPVASQLRMRSAPRFVIDDYDAVPEDIDGEGDPITLLGARQTAFEGREKGLVMSSPALGPSRGIESLAARGTDERFHVRCPHCGTFFVPDIERDLRFDRTAAEDRAAETAHVVCPANGCVIEPHRKQALKASGVWAGPDQTVAADGTVSGPLRATPIASFRIDGLVAFPSWGKLAAALRAAEIAFEKTQSELELRAFFNTRGGKNYVSRLEGADPVTADMLAARAETWPARHVPAGGLFLTAGVDVQGNRFEILVQAWGKDGESWIVDRFAVVAYRGGRDALAPHRVAEHWDVLVEHVLDRAYPLESDPARALPVAGLAVDTGGLPGVHERAKQFAARCLAAGIDDWRVTLVKGANLTTAPAFGKPTFDVDDRGRRIKGAPALFVIGVHALKDTIETRIRVDTPGPGFYHVPRWLDRKYLDELRAEEKQKGLWTRVAARNETWDCSVYAEAQRLRLRPERVDFAHPPVWASPVRIDAARRAAPEAPSSDGSRGLDGHGPRTVANESPSPPRGRRVRSKGIT